VNETGSDGMTGLEVINFSFHNELPEQFASAYLQIARDIRGPFAELIDNLGIKHHGSLIFWLASADLRNQSVCRLFHDLTVLRLLNSDAQLFPKGSIIQVDSEPLSQLLRACAEKQGASFTIVNKLGRVGRFRYAVRKQAFRLKTFAVFFVEVITVCLNTSSRRDTAPTGERIKTIIDTYAIPGFETDDRYFPGLYENLNAADKTRMRFVPKFADMTRKQIKHTAKTLAQHPERFLLREAFITARDLVSIARLGLEISKLRVRDAVFFSEDVSQLVEAELRSADRLHGALRGALSYFFVKRLAESKIRPKRAISWFEGQAIDKGWILGFGRFMPEVVTLGYQGFVAGPMSSRPILSEVGAHVAPKKLGVMGVGFVENVCEFTGQQLITEVAPSFRFRGLKPADSRLEPPSITEEAKVLVALPGERRAALRFLAIVKEAFKDEEFRELLVKPHPRISFEDLRLVSTSKLIWKDVSAALFADLLSDAALVLCPGWTSVGFEAALAGRSVIIVSSDLSERDLMPAAVPKQLWRLVATPKQLFEEYRRFLESYKAGVNYQDMASAAHKSCITPVTSDSVRRFVFGLSDADQSHS